MPELTAKDYIETHRIPHRTFEHLVWPKHQERFQSICGKLSGTKLLDVGCGAGHSVFHMNNFFSGEWVGCDKSLIGIDYAREHFPQFNFYYYDSLTLPFADNHFDSVVCSEVIEHVPDDKTLVSELLRVAKEQVVVTTPSKAVDDPGHIRLYTEEDIRKLFGDNLISIKEIIKAFWLVVAQ